MTMPLRSYPKDSRGDVVKRRIAAKTNGLGFWSSVDYLIIERNRKGKNHVSNEEPEQEPHEQQAEGSQPSNA